MKKIILPVFTVLAGFILNSCGYEMPESMAIRTKADYNFTVGSYKHDFSQYLDSKMLEEKFNSDSSQPMKYKLYDYRADTTPGSSQQFLAEVKLQEIPIDVSAYLSSMDINTNLASKSFEQEITVPSLAVNCENISQPLPDFNDLFKNAASFTIPDLQVPQGINATIPDIPPFSVKIDDPDFKTIQFSSGNLEIKLQSSPLAPEDFSINAKIILTTSAGAEITRSEDTSIGTHGKFILPLTGKTLSPNLKIKISGRSNNGTLGQFTTYKITASLSSDVKIQKITGLKMDLGPAGNLSINQNVNITTDDAFIGCTIAEGLLSATAALPESWTGVIATPNISIAGGLTKGDDSPITEADFDKSAETLPYILNRKINLNGFKYNKGDVKISGSIGLTLDSVSGATLVFSDSSNKIDVTTKCTIEKVKEITIDTSKLGGMADKLEYSASTPFPDTMKAYVEKIVLTRAGISAKYVNTLPAGNDFTISAASNTLFGTSEPKLATIECGSAEEKEVSLESTAKNEIVISTNPTIDYDFKLKLPGATALHPEYAVFKDVEIGKSYKIKMDIKPVFDWESVTILTDTLASKLTNTIESDFNMCEMFKKFSDVFGDDEFYKALKLARLPIYLYCNKPELSVLDKINYKGKIALISENSLTSEKEEAYLLGSSTEDEKLSFKPAKELEFDENGYVTTKLNSYDASMDGEVSNLINETKTYTESKFKIDYELKLTDSDGTEKFTITKDDYETVKGSTQATSIVVYARIILPLEVQFETDATLSLNKIANIESGVDIFKRSEATSIDDYEKYLEAIKSMDISYKCSNNAFVYQNSAISPAFFFDTNMDGLSKKIYELKLRNDSVNIDFDDILAIIKQYPFTPLLQVKMPKTPGDSIVKIPKDSFIEIFCSVGINTDGTVKIF